VKSFHIAQKELAWVNQLYPSKEIFGEIGEVGKIRAFYPERIFMPKEDTKSSSL